MWVRRLYTSPDGRDLVAMDSRRRLFGGLLRRMLVLRDDVCTTPWCEAPIVHADHTTPAREGSPTSFEEGAGKCARCNQGKEAPGWAHRRHGPDSHPEDPNAHDATTVRSSGRRVVQVTTPLGHQLRLRTAAAARLGQHDLPAGEWVDRAGRDPERVRGGETRADRRTEPGAEDADDRTEPAPRTPTAPGAGVTPARRTSASGRCGDARRSATRLHDAHA